jgi:hypothetical protein
MDTTDIPYSVQVNYSGLFVGVFTSTKDPNAPTWSWYPPPERRQTWPHVTVGMADDQNANIQVTGFVGGSTTLQSVRWYKLHVSVDIHGTNLQMYYRINPDWTVTPCGNTMKNIPSHNKAQAQNHADRQSTDYKKFAEAFIAGARRGWEEEVRSSLPARQNVGPQTGRGFASNEGL